MPRKPIDYSKAIIYKIVCKDPSVKDTYVGSTTRFVNRKAQHKAHCQNEMSPAHNLKVYKCIRENENWINWNMVMIEYYPCSSQLELIKRERYFFELLNANLNMVYPSRSKQEYMAKYEHPHKEKRKEYMAEYNNTHKDQLQEYRDAHKEHKKKTSAVYNRQYMIENKQRISENRKKKYMCDCCGRISTIAHRLRHNKSPRHILGENVFARMNDCLSTYYNQ